MSQRICRSKVVQPLGIFLGAFVGRAASWFIWTQAMVSLGCVWPRFGLIRKQQVEKTKVGFWTTRGPSHRVSGTGQSSSYVSWLWIRPGISWHDSFRSYASGDGTRKLRNGKGKRERNCAMSRSARKSSKQAERLAISFALFPQQQ